MCEISRFMDCACNDGSAVTSRTNHTWDKLDVTVLYTMNLCHGNMLLAWFLWCVCKLYS